MASVETRARRDLEKKLELEAQLLSQLRAFNRRVVKNAVKEMAAQSRLISVEDFKPEMVQMLSKHYAETGDVFGKQLTDEMPKEIAVTEDESRALEFALAAYFAERARTQADIINDTTADDLSQSHRQAVEAAELQDQAGVDKIEVATMMGALFGIRLRSRQGAIAMYETQAAAEASKATEAQVLSFQPPAISSPTQRPADVKREWVTRGDERVRPAHASADGQERDLNEPFMVGGDQLRWPGDNSLGASLGNIINCRCSAVVDADNVFAIRRQRGAQPAVDTSVSDQLATSMGI